VHPPQGARSLARKLMLIVTWVFSQNSSLADPNVTRDKVSFDI